MERNWVPMAVTLRDEYFLENGNLVRRTGRRPNGRGRWANERHRDLVVAVEMGEDGIQRVFRGKRHTRDRDSRDREREAIARSYAMNLNESAPDVGRLVPTTVTTELRKRIDDVTKNVASRFRGLSNEERTTGALFGQLPERLQLDGWSVSFHSQGYTSVQKKAKETQIGADAGIVVEVRNAGVGVTKALWVQAKRTSVFSRPDEALKLPKLRDQMKTMGAHTSDGYALIYTPDGVFVTDGKGQWTFGEWLVSAVKCERGDRDPAVIVNTLDRDFLLEMTVTGQAPVP